MLSSFADGAVLGERYGTGEAGVIALHGWQRSHHDFDRVFDGTLSAVALDLPGFGATPPPPEAWGSERYAEAIAPVLFEVADPVVVVGHSFGGRVALQLARSHPDRVRGLVLCGVPQLAPGGPAGRTTRAFRAVRALHRLGVVSEATLDRARMRYGSSDYRSAEGVLRSVLVTSVAERYAPLLPTIECPVALVWGALDSVAPVENAIYAHRSLRSSTLVLLDGVGHMVPTDAPGELRGAIEGLAA